ncbi:hypothetical protein AB0Q95_05240 [Streptomyces sp. NPDC059900]|uniref:hypothetical protein n=1 Tax=Streptomyces sp. NPDC059900 TaxID=3155816 RepID=UPI00341EFF41
MDLTSLSAVELTIDRVTVEGFGRRDSATLRRGIERHFSTLVEEKGLPDGLPSMARDRRNVVIDLVWDGRDDEGLSRVLAARIYDAISGGGRAR